MEAGYRHWPPDLSRLYADQVFGLPAAPVFADAALAAYPVAGEQATYPAACLARRLEARYCPIDVDGTQGYVLSRGTDAIVVFRGTTLEWADIKADCNAKRFRPGESWGAVHSGFYHAFMRAEQVLFEILEEIARSNPRRHILRTHFVGHSLGAAVATVGCHWLAHTRLPAEPMSLITFGSPRVGNSEFAKTTETVVLRRLVRFVNNNDAVTHLPPGHLWNGRHVGQTHYFDADERLHVRPHRLTVALHNAIGLVRAIREPGLDFIVDHSMPVYRRLVHKHFGSYVSP